MKKQLAKLTANNKSNPGHMTITATHRHALKVITQLWPNLSGGGYRGELNDVGGSDILNVQIIKNGAGYEYDQHTVQISVCSSSFPEGTPRAERVEFRGVDTCLEVEVAGEWSPQIGKYYHCVIFTKAGTEVIDIPTKAKRLDARRVACRAVNLLIARLTERWIAEPQPERKPELEPTTNPVENLDELRAEKLDAYTGLLDRVCSTFPAES